MLFTESVSSNISARTNTFSLLGNLLSYLSHVIETLKPLEFAFSDILIVSFDS